MSILQMAQTHKNVWTIGVYTVPTGGLVVCVQCVTSYKICQEDIIKCADITNSHISNPLGHPEDSLMLSLIFQVMYVLMT